MSTKQQTLKAPISFSGKGLHTGVKVTMTVNPAEVDTGIVFRRTDLEGQPIIPALCDYVVDTSRGTTIESGGHRVSTIEHIMSALWTLGVDNAVIDIDVLCALGECGGVVGLNFYPQFLQSDRSAEVLDIAKHGMHILQKAGEDSVALGTDFDGFEAGKNWIRGIEEIECVWDALKKAGMTERQLDKLSYQNVKRVLGEVL